MTAPPEFSEPQNVTCSAQQSPVMTIRDVCRLFGRSDRCIRNWVKAGHLTPRRIGRSVFFLRSEVEALLGRAAFTEAIPGGPE